MNSKTCLLLLSVLSSILTGVATAQELKLGDVYRSQEGRFIIKFPGQAIEQKQSVDTDAGKIEVLMCTCEISSDLAFLVGSNVFPQKLIDALPLEKHIDNVRDGNKNIFPKVLDEKKITYGTGKNELTGRELLLTNELGIHYRARIFISKTRFYQIIVVGKADVVKSDTASLFFDSFEILE